MVPAVKKEQTPIEWPAGAGGCYTTTVSAPSFDPLAFGVNWKALPLGLMYDILDIPYSLEQLDHQIHERWLDDSLKYSEFFWARRHGYAVLGLEISGLAERLRLHASLPPSPQGPGG